MLTERPGTGRRVQAVGRAAVRPLGFAARPCQRCHHVRPGASGSDAEAVVSEDALALPVLASCSASIAATAAAPHGRCKRA